MRIEAEVDVYCEATLNYSEGTGAGHVPVRVPIRDGRAMADALDPEEVGFRLLEHRSAVRDWRDPAHLKAVHAPEVARLAQQLAGCDRVMMFEPIVRSPEMAEKVTDYHPIELVHSDFTDDYRAMLQDPDRPYAELFGPLLEAHGLSRRQVESAERIAVLQFWRNIGARRPDCPLAICDARTVPRSQLFTFTLTEYGGRHVELEVFGVKPPGDAAANHWYAFPGMGTGEVLVFRTYDSRRAAQALPFWTPHSAFHDPHVGVGAPRRESVEMRALCLFGV